MTLADELEAYRKSNIGESAPVGNALLLRAIAALRPQAMPEDVPGLVEAEITDADRDFAKKIRHALYHSGLVHTETGVSLVNIEAAAKLIANDRTAQQATIQEMAGEVERIISALEGAHDDGTSIDGMIHQNELRAFLAKHGRAV